MIVRRLGTADLAAMRAINALFAKAFGDDGGDAYTDAPPSDSWLAERLASPDFIALAAIEDGRIIGAIAAYVLTKFEAERREIYLYDLAVAEDRRRRGVATALINDLRSIARSIGAWVVYVQADHRDPPAVALYAKLGEREDVMHFDIAP
ncbi:AAC(3)-I family aminoglycoside N-acetyltransferase [Sphingomonas sp. FW199]|uniref:AAC(3)-I family aminoglycoside N-acetyltransferase n=1 Tax=Sphingomonas sp. FW199 TaxID=3400217 RepID=UPI003CF4D0F7